jgi:hypothetical protein
MCDTFSVMLSIINDKSVQLYIINSLHEFCVFFLQILKHYSFDLKNILKNLFES